MFTGILGDKELFPPNFRVRNSQQKRKRSPATRVLHHKRQQIRINNIDNNATTVTGTNGNNCINNRINNRRRDIDNNATKVPIIHVYGRK